MKTIIVAVMVLLPQLLFADTDCWVKEYPDHYLAVCNGDEKLEPAPNQPSATGQPTAATEPVTPRQTALQNHPADTANAPRFGRMSRSRVKAAIIVRNKLLQENGPTREGQ